MVSRSKLSEACSTLEMGGWGDGRFAMERREGCHGTFFLFIYFEPLVEPSSKNEGTVAPSVASLLLENVAEADEKELADTEQISKNCAGVAFVGMPLMR